MFINRYIYIIVTIILTSVISVSTHVLILQYYQAPISVIPPYLYQAIVYVIRFGTVVGSMLIYFYSRTYWKTIKPPYRVILFAFLLMAVTESLLREPIMQIIVGIPWQYQILLSIPSYFGFLTISLIICLLLHKVLDKKYLWFWKCVLFAAVTTVLFILVRKVIQGAVAPLMTYVPHPEPNNVHFPYGINILLPAYLTFIEPTIAAFIIFYLIKDQLKTQNTLLMGLIMAGIIMTIHAGIYSILQILYSDGNLFYRIFYYGQFLWEYLTLGLLTAYSFALYRKYNVKIGYTLYKKEI